MRIRHMQLDAYRGLTGSFAFPESGLGLWRMRNGGGKSTLCRAVVAALFGDSTPTAPGVTAGRIRMAFTRDDGTALDLERDLERGRVRVTDSAGADVTDHFAAIGEIGEQIFGLTRPQFEAVFPIAHEGLVAVADSPAVRSWLARSGEADDAAAPAATPPPPPPLPSPEAGFEIERAEDEDLHRVSSLDLSAIDVTIERSDVHADLSASGTHSRELRAALPDPEEANISPVQRLHRLRDCLVELDRRQGRLQADLGKHAERRSEVEAEAQRLSGLSGSEPSDVEEVQGILTAMLDVEREKSRLAEAATRYRDASQHRGIAPGQLELVASRCRSLSEDDREFLAGYREAETRRRGTRARAKSKRRMEASRLAAIGKSRSRAARATILPLFLAVIGVAGSIAASVFPVAWLRPTTSLLLGLAGALAGALMFLRARRLSADEEQTLDASRSRNEVTLERLDDEERFARARLERIAERWKVESPESALDQFDTWTEHASDLAQLEGFARQGLGIERQRSALRERLGRYAASGVDAPDVSQINPEAVYHDYVRYFQIQDEGAAIERRQLELEADLADLEMTRADFRGRIDRMLQAASIDPARDLAEAVEIFALRLERGLVPAPDASGGIATRVVPESRTALLSARVETILRRFLPEVRDVAVDGELNPRLRLDARSPLLEPDRLATRLSRGSMDQVWLALRCAIGETRSPSGESVPIFLDDPLVRADDTRHDRALEFLLEDASERGQVVLLTAQEVRVRWYLHQFPKFRERLREIVSRPSSAELSSPQAPTSSPAS